MNTKYCHHCGTELKGRIDKKFCDDQCRAAHNNKNRTDTRFMRNLNGILRRNRKVLHELMPMKESRIRATRKRLDDKGFNFGYHTHTQTTRTGATYFFCYEYGVLPLKNDRYMLVKRNG